MEVFNALITKIYLDLHIAIEMHMHQQERLVVWNFLKMIEGWLVGPWMER